MIAGRLRRPHLRVRHAAHALFAAQFVLLELATRAPMVWVHPTRFVLGGLASVLVGATLAGAATTRARRVLLATPTGAVLAAQALVVRFYRAPLDAQVALATVAAWSDVAPVVARLAGVTIATVLVAAACELGLLTLAHRGRTDAAPAPRARLAVALVVATCGAALVGTPPDLAFLAALGAPLLAPASARAAHVAGARPVAPAMISTRPELPSVLLVVTESVRASDACSDPAAPCAVAPEVAALYPDRIPLRGMHAVASYTAVSISALFGGLTQVEPRAAITASPDLFDLARAVRGDGDGRARLRVAYWSSQSSALFERSDTERAVDDFVSVETLVGAKVEDDDEVVDRGVDRLLAAHATAALPGLAPPYLLVLHLAGTHAPYFVDPERAPFAPWAREVAWSTLERLHHAYEDAIFAQDRSLAAVLRAFEEAQRGRPHLVFFTSDHGEAFGEHGAIHHGQSLYDEQTHVPAWIHEEGVLTAEERASLRAYEDRTTTHLDVLPTLLDVLGVWDALPLAPERARLGGRSLLRTPTPLAPLPITNCTGMFRCPVSTWGVLDETRVVTAQPWDAAWVCADVGATTSPRDHLDVASDPACARLVEASRRFHATLPNGAPNGATP